MGFWKKCVVPILMGSLLPAAIAQQSAAPTPDLAGWEALVHDTSLTRDGLRPWYLKMSFSLFDPLGKQATPGTLEYWWVSPQSHRLVIRSAAYNETVPAEGTDSATVPEGRAGYLIRDLLNQVMHPVPSMPFLDQPAITAHDQTFSGIKLTCFALSNGANKRPDAQRSAMQYCTLPSTTNLRLTFDANSSSVRNGPARFQGVTLATDYSVAFDGRPGITGTVEALRVFDPATAAGPFHTSALPSTRIPASVVRGKLRSKQNPEYPPSARMNHESGTVILFAIIGKDGHIQSLDVVSTPGKDLAESAVEAVRHWTYEPYQLNGVPTEVETTIMVNFNLRW